MGRSFTVAHSGFAWVSFVQCPQVGFSIHVCAGVKNAHLSHSRGVISKVASSIMHGLGQAQGHRLHSERPALSFSMALLEDSMLMEKIRPGTLAGLL